MSLNETAMLVVSDPSVLVVHLIADFIVGVIAVALSSLALRFKDSPLGVGFMVSAFISWIVLLILILNTI